MIRPTVEQGDGVAQDRTHGPVNRRGQEAVEPQVRAGASERSPRQSQAESLLALFDVVPVAIQIVDAHGQLMDANPAWQRLWGIEPEHFGDYKLSRDNQLVAAGVLAAVEQAFTGEVTVPTTLPPVPFLPGSGPLHGQLCWLRTTVHAVAGAVPPQAILVHEDVTDQRRAEEAREAAEGRLGTVIDNAPIVLFALDRDGRFTLSEGRGLMTLRLAPGEVVGRSVFDLYRGEPSILASARRALAGEELLSVDHLAAVGVTWETRWSPLRDPDGTITGVLGISTDITERRQLEEERERLLAGEQAARAEAEAQRGRLESLLLQAPAIVNIHRGPDHRFDLVHPLMRQLLGGRNIQDLPVQEAVPELENQGIVERLDQVYRTGEPFVGTGVPIRFRQGAGTERIRDFDIVFQPIRDATGAVEGVMTLAVEVTEQMAVQRRGEALTAELATERDRLGAEVAERRRAEAALALSQERLELAQQAGQIGAFEYDLRTGAVTWSEELEALYGLPPGGFGGKYVNWSQAVHPDDLAQAEAAVGRAIATGGEFEAEFRVIWPDGSTRWLAARGRVYPDATGRAVRLIGVNMDVTHRRQAEDRLRFLAEASSLLAGSLDYTTTLQSVAHLAVPGIADWCAVDVVDDDGVIERLVVAHVDPDKVDMARSLQQRYPSDPNASFGVPHVLRTGRSEIYPVIDDALLRASARDDEHLALLRAVGLRSGMIVPLLARGRVLGAISLVAAESGRTFGEDDLALAEDLARRAAAAVDNARLFSQAQAAVRARDQFLSIAAHELRTPVAGLKGYAQMLLRAQERGHLAPQRLGQALRTINTASDRLATLTDDLLDVSRIRLGQLPLRPVPLDLAALARDVGTRFADGLASNHLVVLDLPDGAHTILADAARMEQVLTNLLDNARKYAPGGGEIRLALRSGADGLGLELSVQDQGIGLPPGTAEVIFEPFGRAANAAARNLPGLGLGLYICRNIVERHGGRVWAESSGDGQGTTVRIWLPVESAPAPSASDGDPARHRDAPL